MALNSSLVMNRLGLEPSEAAALPTPEPLNDTYTASRLGLTFAGRDEPVAQRPVEPPASKSGVIPNTDTLDARLGISSSSKEDRAEPKARKPFWPRFRNAASVLAIAVRKGIIEKLIPRPTVKPSADTLEDFKAHPAACPSPKPTESDPTVVYRKGTYKMPAELISRLKDCAKTSHKYQYRVVIESLDEYLTANGFAHGPDPDDTAEE